MDITIEGDRVTFRMGTMGAVVFGNLQEARLEVNGRVYRIVPTGYNAVGGAADCEAVIIA